ncbi:hypothetical protein NP493_103g06016 [Ridgeia piscesae]|uniref:Serpin domain-containing protein n=1 Tax=Ridgeia piscesae TaxID=27915 RepID=A0AAD9P7S7_RIDPI|nr:hypothetical protein NP493_103g06016 [Ridgeia piscesae]
MMHMTVPLPYSWNSSLKCKILGLPYKSKRFAMYVSLPNKSNGLTSLERKTNYRSVTSALDRLQTEQIDVSFPKFEITPGIRLRNTLRAMGGRAFNTRDFATTTSGFRQKW